MSEGRDTLLDIPTICFGFTLGFMTLTASTVGKQTMSIYKRRGGAFSLYLFMIWVELVVCLAWAISAWLFLRGDIKGGYVSHMTQCQRVPIYRMATKNGQPLVLHLHCHAMDYSDSMSPPNHREPRGADHAEPAAG